LIGDSDFEKSQNESGEVCDQACVRTGGTNPGSRVLAQPIDARTIPESVDEQVGGAIAPDLATHFDGIRSDERDVIIHQPVCGLMRVSVRVESVRIAPFEVCTNRYSEPLLLESPQEAARSMTAVPNHDPKLKPGG